MGLTAVVWLVPASVMPFDAMNGMSSSFCTNVLAATHSLPRGSVDREALGSPSCRRLQGGRRPMPIINRIADFHPEMTQWRHQIHAHPETAFEEHKTAAFVAERLESFGITVERGIAGTGVIGTLRVSVEGRR